MRIKDIAEMARVSVSTVSKIMNNKDESISEQTKERVLKIIKEYNYVPYSANGIRRQHHSFTIGMIANDKKNILSYLAISKRAQELGYTTLMRLHNDSYEEELKNIATLISHQVDGVLWEPFGDESKDFVSRFLDAKIPFQFINTSSMEDAWNLDFQGAAYQATSLLIEKGHNTVLCLVNNSKQEESFIDGFKLCLFQHGIGFLQNNVFTTVDHVLLQRIIDQQATALVANDYGMALDLYKSLQGIHFHIPEDFSLVTLKEDYLTEIHYPNISSLSIPLAELGVQAVESLIRQLETGTGAPVANPPFTLSNFATISVPPSLREKNIMVVGSINIDHYMRVEELPVSGKSTITSDYSSYPGGKGINQAIGVAKLKGQSILIGAVGDDMDSETIFSSLSEYNIQYSGLYKAMNEETGKAYIFLDTKGESMISILSGANQHMTKEIVAAQEHLFKNLSFCLLPTEIPIEAISEAAKLAKKHHAKTILKPAARSHLSDELIQNIDIFVPNHDEIHTLCPANLKTLEAQADHFLHKGVKEVIITLGSKGCFYKNAAVSKYYDAVDFTPVDNTGAADAFVSALAVSLHRNFTMDQAIRIASYAAGYSVSKEGVLPALIDGPTLESYISQNFQ